MPGNSTGPANDIAPVAAADAFSLSAQQAGLVTQTTFSYVDQDPTSPTYGQTLTGVNEVDGFVLDVTANDSDANPNDAGHFWIFDLTQPVDQNGVPQGSVSLDTAADGHQVVRFYDPNGDLTHDTVLTFTYRAGDQWATSDPSTWANTVSAPVTVTVTIKGNAIPGETLTAPDDEHHHRPQPIEGGGGNDLVLGGEGRDTLNGNAGADTLVGDEGKDLLSGGDGNDWLVGGGRVFHWDDDHHHGGPPPILWSLRGDDDGGDTLNGGAGDDTLTGGGEHDRFVFDYAFGHDVITDFRPHDDKIVADHNMWVSFADMKAHAAQVSRDVVLTSDFGGYTITLQNVKLSSLFQSDFIFN